MFVGTNITAIITNYINYIFSIKYMNGPIIKNSDVNKKPEGINAQGLKNKSEKALLENEKLFLNKSLILAIESKCFDRIENLIKEGANINFQGEDGKTVLINAIESKNLEVVKLLVEKGADLNIQDDWGYTALKYSFGNKFILKYLLEQNIDVNIPNRKGTTPLMFFIKNSKELGVKEKEIIELLIEKGADINVMTKNNSSALSFAVEKLNYDVVELLFKKGANLNDSLLINYNWCGSTLLMYSIYKEQFDIALLLIEKGVDVNQTNVYKDCAIIVAINKNNETIVKKLIEKGAHLNLKDFLGNNLIFGALKNVNIVKMLVDAGIPFDERDSIGQTPLMCAARDNCKETLEYLLEKGAQVNTKCKNNMTALDYSILNKNDEISEILLKKGAKIRFFQNIFDLKECYRLYKLK